MGMNIEAAEMPIEEVEQKRIEELNRANTEELVRRFGNLTLEEQAAIATKMDATIMKAELSYRENNEKAALNGFMMMAEKYKEPDLRNYYCANQCPLGIDYVPEVKIKALAHIALEMLSSLNSMDKKKERLIEIAADGTISADEMKDFVFIETELEHIAMTVDTLQLWIEKMRANGSIDQTLYDAYKNEK